MTPRRVLERIKKLLRLATDPATNDPTVSDNEARTAALEAAKLMREYDVEIGDAPPAGCSVRVTPSPEQPRPPTPRYEPEIRVTWRPSQWYHGALGRPSRCLDCGGTIRAAEPGWHRPQTNDHLHDDWPCSLRR